MNSHRSTVGALTALFASADACLHSALSRDPGAAILKIVRAFLALSSAAMQRSTSRCWMPTHPPCSHWGSFLFIASLTYGCELVIVRTVLWLGVLIASNTAYISTTYWDCSSATGTHLPLLLLSSFSMKTPAAARADLPDGANKSEYSPRATRSKRGISPSEDAGQRFLIVFQRVRLPVSRRGDQTVALGSRENRCTLGADQSTLPYSMV